MLTHQKINGKSSQECRDVFCFFLSPIQSGVSATYPAAILTAFEIENVNPCPHAYTGKKF